MRTSFNRDPEEFAGGGFPFLSNLAQRTPAASDVRRRAILAHDWSASRLNERFVSYGVVTCEDFPLAASRSASGSPVIVDSMSKPYSSRPLCVAVKRRIGNDLNMLDPALSSSKPGIWANAGISATLQVAESRAIYANPLRATAKYYQSDITSISHLRRFVYLENAR